MTVAVLRRWAAALAAALLFAVSQPSRSVAHDVPAGIVVTGFVKPEGQSVSVLLRLPIVLFLDLDLPKRGPGYLDLERLPPLLPSLADAATRWLQLSSDGTALTSRFVAGRVALPSDRAFTSYETALSAIRGAPLATTENLFWNQGFLDLELAYPGARDPNGLTVAIDIPPALRDRVTVTLRYIAPDGAVRAFEIKGSAEFALDPSWSRAAAFFVQEGILHILGGLDHLLFLLCLVVPFRRNPRGLVGVVTAFTLGHSATLLAAALGYVPRGAWFSPTIETLIAVSIVYMAAENLVAPRFDRRWLLAAGFGLVHGFGFAGSLSEQLQFAGSHLLASLLAFNVGIELGQLGVLAVGLPILNILLRSERAARYGTIGISLVVGHEAWHWAAQRATGIRLSELTVSDLAEIRAVLLAGAIAALAVVLVRMVLRRAPAGSVAGLTSGAEESRR